MTRIAIVAPTEELRAALAAALRTDARFDVVSVGTDEREVSAAADVVVVARPSAETSLSARTAHDDIADSAVLANRERPVRAHLADGLANQTARRHRRPAQPMACCSGSAATRASHPRTRYAMVDSVEYRPPSFTFA